MTEDQIQAQCVMWFNNTYPLQRGYLFAIPNGRKRDLADAVILKATGVIKGPSDLAWVIDGGRVLWLECKTEIGVQSKEQKDWQRKVEQRGHKYILFRNLNEFKEIVWQTIGK